MKNFLVVFVFSLFVSSFAQGSEKTGVWQSAFHHEAGGKVISGSKDALLDAIRNGAEIRLYYKAGRVEHLIDAGFITVFKGEVFAQIDRIKGQAPSREEPVIDLRITDYYGLYSTNGKFEINWFVRR